ncbi:MAG: sterol desaturase family protein [Caulobacteraceae bacterium]
MEQVFQFVWGVLSGQGFLIMIGVFCAFVLFEQFWPARPTHARHYGFNFAYAIVNALAVALILPVIAAMIAFGPSVLGSGHVDVSTLGAPNLVRDLVVMLFSTLLFDFFYYWLHRLQHEWKVLWPEHLLHHSDEHVNVTTSSRTHILEQFLFPLFILGPMAILFKLPPISAFFVALAPTLWGYLIHANVRLGWGPLWWLVTSPQYHRVHHSTAPAHINKNYAVWFPVWDIVFGSAYRPAADEYPPTGVVGVRVRGLGHAYALPFLEWARMLGLTRRPVSAGPALTAQQTRRDA